MSNSVKSERPLLVVLSAPSGAGKTTLATRLLSKRSDIVRSVSCTTRAPRGQEVNGKDYHFISSSEFERKKDAGDFLECALVHGNMYGTPRENIDRAFEKHLSIIMVIDVQGARQVRDYVSKLDAKDRLRKGFVDIFVMPPSLDVLKGRLENRGEDSLETIERRIDNAKVELESAKEFQYAIVNSDLEKAFLEINEVINGETNRQT